MPKLLLFCLLLITSRANAQNIDRIVAQDRQQVERVEVKPSERVTFISSNFAKPQITTTGLRDKVKILAVTKVYYVYTAYKRSVNFNQKSLDKKRFEQLKLLYPILFQSPLIEWEIIEQTGLDIHTDGEGYFHGFILIHRPLPTDEGRKKEFDLVSNYFDNPDSGAPLIEEDPVIKILEKTESIEETASTETSDASFEGGDQALLEHIQSNFKTPNDVWKDRKDFWAKFTVVVDEKGNTTTPRFKEPYGKSVEKEIESVLRAMPKWKPKTINGIVLKDTVDFEWRVSYSPQVKGMFIKNGKPPLLDHMTLDPRKDPIHSSKIGAKDIVSSPVFIALSNLQKEQNLAVVMDVTGSMANHIISASFWLNKNKDNLPFSSFTAFNDGDDKEDSEKEIGATGGIYFTSFVSEFSNSIRKAMLNGNGGDYPENDIEAMLFAVRKDVKAAGILLIADNFSSVKDFELLSKVDLPVNILPCGLTGSINKNYLDITFKTGGKIFYNDQVIDLQSLKRGATFQIRKTKYVVTGRSVEVVG